MLVPLEGYYQAWQQIKQESMSHSTYRVVVFVACMNVDAFAAARMLGSLLKKHLILHNMRPVVGYESLREGYTRLDSNVRNVFFVGCGANVDIEELLGLNDEETTEHRQHPKIHVLDSIRPWNLNNLFGSENVHCYDDGNAEELDPFRDAYQFLSQELNDPDSADLASRIEGSDISDASDQEGEQDAVSERENESKRKRMVDSDSEGEEEKINSDEGTQRDEGDLDSEMEATQEDDIPADPQRDRQQKRRRTQHKHSNDLLEQYYQKGSYLSVTSAVQVYTLLTLIGETSPPALWLAVLGLTSLEPQHPQLYDLLLPSLRDEMVRLNTNNDLSMGSTSQSTIRASSSSAAKGDLGSRSIKFHPAPDYSLFLLRQWSLYESMVHSSYVSAKLYLWREDGRKKLHKLLARIGITLQDSKELWIHANPSLKRDLRSKLTGIQRYYGLEGILRDGAVRQFGLNGAMSAGDCVESIAAYLEAGSTPVSMIAGASTPAGSAGSLGPSSSTNGVKNGHVPGKEGTEERQDAWVSNFWTAWDAVDEYDRLIKGIEQAKMLQKAVVSTSNFLFEKNVPKDLHSFRMVIVQEAPDIEVFLNPLSLQRLAVWISESCAELHDASTPLVMAVLNEEDDVFLVFGMPPHKARDQPEQSGDTKYNHFGRQFQETAAETNARIKVDAFDSSIIEISRDDLPRFLEALDTHVRTSGV